MQAEELEKLIAYNKQEEERMWNELRSEQQILVNLGQKAYRAKKYNKAAQYARRLQNTGLTITQAGAWIITPWTNNLGML